MTLSQRYAIALVPTMYSEIASRLGSRGYAGWREQAIADAFWIADLMIAHERRERKEKEQGQ